MNVKNSFSSLLLILGMSLMNTSNALAESDSITISFSKGTTSISSGLEQQQVGGVTTLMDNGVPIMSISDNSYGTDIHLTDEADDLKLVLTGKKDKLGVTIFNTKKLNLTLSERSLKSENSPALNIQNDKKVTLTLVGDNLLEDSGEYQERTLDDGEEMDQKAALFFEDKVEVKGKGSLSIHSQKNHAFASDRTIEISSGNLMITSDEEDGIRATDAFIMNNGQIAIDTKKGKGIKVKGKERTNPLGYIIINDGLININSYDKAITASWVTEEDAQTAELSDDPTPYVTINGGEINITTFGVPTGGHGPGRGGRGGWFFSPVDTVEEDSLSPEGIESKTILTINGGLISINATDDALNAGNEIIINGGDIKVTSTKGDAIDSNGTILMTDGRVVAVGAPGRGEGGLDCDRNDFVVTGGSIMGFGGRNSSPTMSLTTQNFLRLTNTSKANLQLKDSFGSTIMNYSMTADHSDIILSFPELSLGDTYELYKDGALLKSFILDSSFMQLN